MKKITILLGLLLIPLIGMADASEQAFKTEISPHSAEFLSNDEAAKALSDYILNINAKVFTLAALNDIHLSKIKQDIAFSNLEQYVKDAESMKESAQKLQAEMDALPWGASNNLTDLQREQFEAIQEASFEIDGGFVSLAVDIAVGAHVGLNMTGEYAKDMKALEKSMKSFKKVAALAYKKLGIPEKSIDKDSMLIKK